MISSCANSNIRWFKHINVSETDFYLILRALNTLSMETELISGTLMFVNYLTQASAHDDFIEEWFLNKT
jgi:hypothetical protein